MMSPEVLKEANSPLQGTFHGRPILPELPRLRADFAACTIMAKNYLPMARVLADSFQRCNPGCPFFVLLMDPVEGYFQPEKEPFYLLEARQLPVANLEGMLFKYTILEASTAVKPALLRKLFDDHDIRKLVYLDPDILVLASLQALSDLLSQYSIVLTPHITRPYLDTAKPSDHGILQAGSFNLGFIGLQNTSVTQKLLRWWQDKLYHHGLIAFESNMFVDQRWMDLAPAFLGDELNILRDPGYNVAYWNLHERHITFKNESVLVNGGPCYFFHFSGFNPDDMSAVSKYQDRFNMLQLGDAKLLFLKYRKLVMAHSWNETKNWPYTYNFFENGSAIPDSVRRFYWSLGENIGGLGNPFAWLNEAPADSEPRHESAHAQDKYPYGVNLMGYVTSEKGMGEAARSNLRIVKSTGIRYVTNNFVDTGSVNLEALPHNFSNKNPYRINLININADQMPYFTERNNGYLRGHYNIGRWEWELSSFPKEWCGSFAYLDEVWMPSRFGRDSVAEMSPLPVTCVPHSIDPDIRPDPQWTRDRFGIPPDVFVYLFFFDFHSLLERKNPIGLIRAFKQAFGDRKDVLLLIKSMHADSEDALQQLRTEIQTANVRMFNDVLPRQATHSLMQISDCYVSLHRSEGFGLTLSEAMMCGKPVIATGYSGNIDFMTEDNSFLVPYRLIEIERDHGPYKKGCVWADPDLSRASEFMLKVFEDRAGTREVAGRGRAHVLAKLHPRVIAESVTSRLNSLSTPVQICVTSR